MTSLRARRLAAWFAMLAISLAALVPTVSRALAWGSASPVSWTEVCTASGLQWINLAATAAPDAGDTGQSLPARGATLDHCPLCLLTADRLGPPSSPPSPFWVRGDPVAPAIGSTQVFRSLAPLAAPARGPPLNTPPPFVA
jgi:hypothetical protein